MLSNTESLDTTLLILFVYLGLSTSVVNLMFYVIFKVKLIISVFWSKAYHSVNSVLLLSCIFCGCFGMLVRLQ